MTKITLLFWNFITVSLAPYWTEKKRKKKKKDSFTYMDTHIHRDIFICFLYIFSLLFDVSIFNPTDEAELQSSALLSYSLTFHWKLSWTPVEPVLHHCSWNKKHFLLSFASLEHINDFRIENHASDEYL